MKTKSEIFNQAHKIAKTYEGNYMACFAEALRVVCYDLKKINGAELSIEAKNTLKSIIVNKNGIFYAFVKDVKVSTELENYAYKFWSVPQFDGVQMFFSEYFINNTL